MGNIIIGLSFIIGGFSGKLVLVGTNNSEALVAVGAGLFIWGVVRMLKSE